MNIKKIDNFAPVLAVNNGQFSYSLENQNKWHLSIDHFEVFQRSLTLIMGGNMSGKTTLLNLLSGRQKFSNADVRIYLNGRPASSASLRQQTALLSNDDPMFPEFSIWDNIRIGLPPEYDQTPQRWRDQTAAFLTQSNIATEKDLDRPLSSLSTGGRALVKFCRAIIGRHSLIIIDEISSYLDNTRAAYFIEQLFHLLSGQSSVIFVTHNPRDLDLIGDIAKRQGHSTRHFDVVRTGNRSELVRHAVD